LSEIFTNESGQFFVAYWLPLEGRVHQGSGVRGSVKEFIECTVVQVLGKLLTFCEYLGGQALHLL
jgi:hypothetical protein